MSESLIEQSLNMASGLVNAGPLSFAQSIKYKQVVYTYAQLVSFGTTPQQVIGAVAGKMLIPILFLCVTNRTNNTAGTTVPNQLRYNGSATSIMGANVSGVFANGPGSPLIQFQQAGLFNAPWVGTGNVDYRSTAVMFVPTANYMATGCVGTLGITIAYLEVPVTI